MRKSTRWKVVLLTGSLLIVCALALRHAIETFAVSLVAMPTPALVVPALAMPAPTVPSAVPYASPKGLAARYGILIAKADPSIDPQMIIKADPSIDPGIWIRAPRHEPLDAQFLENLRQLELLKRQQQLNLDQVAPAAPLEPAP